MDIEKVSISLPAQQVAWIESRVAGGGYGNRSEYIRELIRHDQRRHELEGLRGRLLECEAPLRRGEGIDATEAWFESLLARLAQRTTDEQGRDVRERGGRGAV